MQGTYFDDCVLRMELKSCAVHPTPLGLLVHIDLDLSDIKHGRVTGSSFGLILILGAPSHLANVCHGPGISGRPPRTAAVTPETLPNLRRWGFLLCVCVCVCSRESWKDVSSKQAHKQARRRLGQQIACSTSFCPTALALDLTLTTPCLTQRLFCLHAHSKASSLAIHRSPGLL